MNYQASSLAIIIFLTLVALVLGISYFFARKARSADGYFAAGGTIHWSVNGIAFAGDYLSAASFLGICGMIAFFGFDGFLYSIGYLAGWIVALFVVAEPLKRLGKYTFTDALDSKFDSRGIKLMASISTIIVSMFYLIPQMVGAGSLVTPLLGLPHWAGVLIVGTVVILIVATAGMTSTTYVQFIKGGLLLVFSLALVVGVLFRGISTQPDQGGTVPFHDIKTIEATAINGEDITLADKAYTVKKVWDTGSQEKPLSFVKLEKDGIETIWKIDTKEKMLEETLSVTHKNDGTLLYNGAIKEEERFFQVGHMSEINDKKNVRTGTLNPFSFISTIKEGTIMRWNRVMLTDEDAKIAVYYQNPTMGKDVIKPGLYYKLDADKGATPATRFDFVSLMIALFLGTAALPHVLIRYYTVPSPTAARKSTIVAIAAIGLFYILTLYMGLGAMVNGVLDVTNDNMSAPLLAKSFGITFFAIITAIAFATVLGTVSGLIVASSGAVAHDFMDRFLKIKMTEKKKVASGKIAAISVGIIAMFLGIVFQGMNVSFLVGWAFSVAASANFPAIIMLLFWKKTTAKGIIASITAGLVSAVGLILLSQKTFDEVYHLTNVRAPVQISNPAIISVPISFIILIIVSLITQNKKKSVR